MTWFDYKIAYDMVLQTWIIVFENIQNIRQNHKLHHECYRKLKGGEASSGRFTITTTIRYSNDAIQP